LAPIAVLLVEDDPEDVTLLQWSLALSVPGVALTVTGTIAAAIDALDEFEFDCVLLDLGLPDADGLDGLGTLLRMSPPPVLVLTGRDDDHLALSAISMGAEDYLAKNDLAGEALGRAIRYAIERRRAADLLQQRATQHRWVVDSLGEGLAVYARDGRVLSYNGAAERILWSLDYLACLAGLPCKAELLLPDGRVMEPRDAPLQVALRTGEPVVDTTVGITRPGGEVRWLSVNAVPVFERDDAGEMGVVLSFQDVTTTRRAERRVQLGFEQAATGLALADPDGRFTEVNPALCSILGRTKEELLGTTLAGYAAADGTSGTYASQFTTAGHDRRTGELRVVRADGAEVWLWVTTTLVREVAGESYWIQQLLDVTDRKRAEGALEQLAISDPLTGLPNQSLLKDRVDMALSRAEHGGARVAVILVGIDRFRVVNDTLGHSAGDALLVQFAASLQAVADDRTVARVGGDVFAIVVEGVVGVNDTVHWARRQLRAAADHRFEVNGSEVYVTFSTGIAVSGAGATAEGLIRNADLSMGHAKDVGGAQVVAFEERSLETVREGLALETDLRWAIADNQIRVAYQPIVRTDDHRIIGAEALARCYHPRHGDVPPEVFVPVLVRMGLVGELTSKVVREACTQVVEWRREGRVDDDFRVSVNLSAEDLVNTGLVEEIQRALEMSGLEPAALVLEVTESGLIRDTAAALDCLRAIRRLGVRLAVDDFGTGYSSLSYLKMFPVDVVKIDKSFVLGLGRDADATALVRGILSLTRALGLTAVAEGIENDIQLEALRQLGCTLAQGYFWCGAVPPDEFPTACSGPPPTKLNELVTVASTGFEVTDQTQHMGWPVLDALPTAVAVLGSDGTIMATNLAWKRLALERGESASTRGVGANYLAVCEGAQGPGAEDAALAARGLRAVMAGDRDVFTLEYDRNDHGDRRRYLMMVSPVASGSGSVVVAHLDITDRHVVELALAESEERFRNAFDQAPLGIVRLDTNGRVVDANRALCELVGRSPDDLQGSHRDELFADPVESPETGVDNEQRAGWPLKGQGSSQRKVRRPDGTVRIVQVNDVVVDDEMRGLHAIIATVEDVTDRLRLADDLRRAQEMEALGRLAGGIAHEINTPTQFISDNLAFLSNIWGPIAELVRASRSAADRLRTGEPPGDVAALLEQYFAAADLDFVEAEVPAALAQSQEGVERVATIVRAMKAFGHPDRDDPEPTDINRLISNSITVARNEFKYVADVATDFADLPTVMCYQGAVGQVILNLLVNAAYVVANSGEVGNGRGLITVKTWADGAQACVSVSDTGPGIPADVLPHIFEPFFTTKPLGHGTGQGLAMAWATVVERHAGRIDVETSMAGTTFVLRLPIGTAPQTAPPSSGLIGTVNG
jgi:diguanylate cyclase (GGDEF)-like protein/PAS domain S-box-containing protein